jgi:hypothetical protein
VADNPTRISYSQVLRVSIYGLVDGGLDRLGLEILE